MKWIFVFTGLFVHTLFWGQNQLAILKPSLKDLKIEAPTGTAAYSSIPFEVFNRMIYLEASIDGKTGVCILDTGSPSVIVNRETTTTTSMQAATLSSELEIRETVIRRLQLGEMKKKNLRGLAVPFGEFASGHSEEVLGLVGYSLLKDYETLYDFENKLLHLFPSHNAAIHRAARPVKQVEILMEGHLPVVTIQMGERKLRFGLDTGAATNILDEALIGELPKNLIQWLPMEQMRCLNGRYQDVEAATVNQLSIDDYPLEPMKFLFVDLSKVNENTEEKLDGLLGYAFFSQLLCSLNYQQQQLNIWERKNVQDVF
jgi:predicted aspartyl protease